MRSNKYMAKSPKPQEVFTKIHFFVNYVKMLCKHYYVNGLNADVFASGKLPKTPICGRIAEKCAQHIDFCFPVRRGKPAVISRQGNPGEKNKFVILTMLYFMSPPSFPGGRPPLLPRAALSRLTLPSLFAQQSRQQRPAEYRRRHGRAVDGKLRRTAQRNEP